MRLPKLIVLAIAATGCGPKESNAVDLEPVDGVPVKVEHVRMTQTRFAALGGGGAVSLSGSDAYNAIAAAYDVRVTGAIPEHASVSARLTCLIDGYAVASPLAADAGGRLAQTAEGSTLAESTVFTPVPFGDGIPEVCEVGIYFIVSPPLASDRDAPPGRTEQPIGTLCFASNELTVGACSADVLPRRPASDPIEVSEVAARIGTIREGQYGVEATILITAGADAPATFNVNAEASCEVDGSMREVPLSLLTFGRDLPAGVSLVGSGSSSHVPMDREPTACTIRMSSFANDERKVLREDCIRPDGVTAGACG